MSYIITSLIIVSFYLIAYKLFVWIFIKKEMKEITRHEKMTVLRVSEKIKDPIRRKEFISFWEDM